MPTSATPMALTTDRILCNTLSIKPYNHLPPHHSHSFRQKPSYTLPRTSFTVAATKKFSSRTGKFDSKNRRSSTTTKEEEEERRDDIGNGFGGSFEDGGVSDVRSGVDDGFVMPELPGEKPDFWEGPQWDAFGFFVQYMWAFGVVFALIACGIAVATYNEGATDFKETPAYKESIQSQKFLEEPDASSSDVFESNPTEDAPSLE